MHYIIIRPHRWYSKNDVCQTITRFSTNICDICSGFVLCFLWKHVIFFFFYWTVCSDSFYYYFLVIAKKSQLECPWNLLSHLFHLSAQNWLVGIFCACCATLQMNCNVNTKHSKFLLPLTDRTRWTNRQNHGRNELWTERGHSGAETNQEEKQILFQMNS